MKNLIIIPLLLVISLANLDDDIANSAGMINQTIYSGFLKTATQNRSIHYVFIKSNYDFENAPVAVWLNGGPGCSSLAGMLQQIGPCLIGNSYEQGQILKQNPHTWSKAAHLLFLQSPAIVGFSSDSDFSYHYTDEQTADDAFSAIKDFFLNKAPIYREKDFYITGESYAGKYIPDIAVRILNYNTQASQAQKINLKGLMIGNGVMDFTDNRIEKSQIQYMYGHDFIDDRLWTIYQSSCMKDFNSPRCQYFQMEFSRFDSRNVNPYYVYEVCKQGRGTQGYRLMQAVSQMNSKKKTRWESKLKSKKSLTQIPECYGDKGAIEYWNMNKHNYNVDNVNKTWQVCYDINYTIGEKGSMEQYKQLFESNLRIWLYNGDWDDVVPYRDTQINLDKLGARKVGKWQPWYYTKHHAGFYQEYEKLTVITVKGASHMVPQTKPAQAYQLFYNFINNKPVNSPIS